MIKEAEGNINRNRNSTILQSCLSSCFFIVKRDSTELRDMH